MATRVRVSSVKTHEVVVRATSEVIAKMRVTSEVTTKARVTTSEMAASEASMMRSKANAINGEAIVNAMTKVILAMGTWPIPQPAQVSKLEAMQLTVTMMMKEKMHSCWCCWCEERRILGGKHANI